MFDFGSLYCAGGSVLFKESIQQCITVCSLEQLEIEAAELCWRLVSWLKHSRPKSLS